MSLSDNHSDIEVLFSRRGVRTKPMYVAMMEYLIRTFTNVGETMPDSSAGSDTTLMAALNTNRSFTGIEKGPKFFHVAEARIKGFGV